METRLCGIGLFVGIVCAIFAWCTHNGAFEIGAIVGILLAIFGYAYMDK